VFADPLFQDGRSSGAERPLHGIVLAARPSVHVGRKKTPDPAKGPEGISFSGGI